MEFLNDLRKKPSHVRTRVAFGGALGVTLFIALIWSTTLPARLSEIGGTLQEGAEQTAAVETGLDTLIQGIQQEVIPEEQPIEEDPEVEELKIGAFGDLDSWNEENSTSTVSGERTVSSNPSPGAPLVSGEAATSTTPQERVILIGTTTKKAE